jgi:hypothetical protein
MNIITTCGTSFLLALTTAKSTPSNTYEKYVWKVGINTEWNSQLLLEGKRAEGHSKQIAEATILFNFVTFGIVINGGS